MYNDRQLASNREENDLPSIRAFVIIITAFALAGCIQAPRDVTVLANTPRPTAAPTNAPTKTPPPTTIPSPKAKAPGETFIKRGSTARLSGGRGVQGQAIVAGLQTLIIREFRYDPTLCAADLRLVNGDSYTEPVAILYELGDKDIAGEILVLEIPAAATPRSADRLVLYCPDTETVLAEGLFQEP